MERELETEIENELEEGERKDVLCGVLRDGVHQEIQVLFVSEEDL